jgi:hypothetical protein
MRNRLREVADHALPRRIVIARSNATHAITLE